MKHLKKQLWSLVICLGLAVGAFAGHAYAFEALPGANCIYTPTGLQSVTNTAIVPFATQTSNVSAIAVQVTCPLTTQASHSTLVSWEAWLDGTAPWTAASCDVFWSNAQGTTLVAFPTNLVGEGKIAGGRAVIGSNTPVSFGGNGGPAVLVCNMPARSTIFSYISSES
jgi:hypothetical protein